MTDNTTIYITRMNPFEYCEILISVDCIGISQPSQLFEIMQSAQADFESGSRLYTYYKFL